MRFDSADVVIVGGGTIGTTTAYELRKRGYDVVIVEQRYLAYGASGRNAGFINISTRNAGMGLELARAGAAMYDEYVDVLGNSFEYRRNGGIVYFFTPEQQRVYREFVELRKSQGLPMELLDRDQVREIAPILPDSVLGATFCAEDGQISSPRFVRALGEHLRRVGVRIHEETAFTGFLRSGSRVTGIQTTRGPINAQTVIMATGAWSTLLAQEGVEIPIQPTRLGVLATEPVKAKLNVVALGPLCAKQYQMMRDLPSFDEKHFIGGFEDPEGGHEYLDVMVQTADGSLQVGNPEDYTGTLNQHTTLIGTKMMVESILSKWPEFKALGVTGLWSGLLPVTPDALPIVDRLPGHDGVLLAAGHVYGNAAGPSTARLLAETISGEPTSLDISQLSFDRPSLNLQEGASIRW